MKDDALFQSALKDVMKWEGGFSDHPNDNGGATKYGISLRFYRDNIDPDAGLIDMMDLTQDEAEQIYYDHFWKNTQYGDLPFSIGKRMFNFAVNMGIGQANRLLQRAIWNVSNKGIKVDGIVGYQTRTRLGELSADDKTHEVVAALKSEAAGYYRLIAAKNPSQRVFLRGWLNRAYA